MDIILYLLQFIQYQHQQICWLLNFICRYIPLKQWAFEDSHSPKYQKFCVDKLPVIKTFIQQDYRFLLEYYFWKYKKNVRPVQRRNGRTIPEDTVCPVCGAPHQYIYDNNGGNGQFQCKVCGQTFVTSEQVTAPLRFTCPYCGHPGSDEVHKGYAPCHPIPGGSDTPGSDGTGSGVQPPSMPCGCGFHCSARIVFPDTA